MAATSISHDSHNIIVVGTNSADMAFAANYIVEHHGGIVVAENGSVKGRLCWRSRASCPTGR